MDKGALAGGTLEAMGPDRLVMPGRVVDRAHSTCSLRSSRYPSPCYSRNALRRPLPRRKTTQAPGALICNH
eukprot:3461993-Pyramimonas_sp.AAC.1